MFDFLKKIFGTKSAKVIQPLQAEVTEINSIFSGNKIIFFELSNYNQQVIIILNII